jgi:hypothetical protein
MPSAQLGIGGGLLSRNYYSYYKIGLREWLSQRPTLTGRSSNGIQYSGAMKAGCVEGGTGRDVLLACLVRV